MPDIGQLDTKTISYNLPTYAYKDRYWNPELPLDISIKTFSPSNGMKFSLDRALVGTTKEATVVSQNIILAVSKNNPSEIRVFSSESDGTYRMDGVYEEDYHLIALPTESGITAGLLPRAEGPLGLLDSEKITPDIRRLIIEEYSNYDDDSDYVVSYMEPLYFDNEEFTDRRSLVWTPTGNVELSETETLFNQKSMRFFGGYIDSTSNEYLKLDEDFTFEGWLYIDTASTGFQGIAMLGTGAYDGFYIYNGDFGWYQGGMKATIPISNFEWHHIAGVFDSGTLTCYVDGVKCATPYTADILSSPKDQYRFGANNIASETLNGYLEHVKIYKDFVKYTDTFTPPTLPTHLRNSRRDPFLPYTTSYLDMEGTDGATSVTDLCNHVWTFNGTSQLSTSNFKIGSSSLLLDGDSDYISAPFSTDFDITSGNFSIDAWIYRLSSGSRMEVFNHRNGTEPPSEGWALTIDSDDTLRFFFVGGSDLSTTTTVPSNQWTHIAATRFNDVIYLFIDGVLEHSATVSDGTTDNGDMIIGCSAGSSDFFDGYIDSPRINKGEPRFTPQIPYYEIDTAPRFWTHPEKANFVSHLPFDGANNDTETSDNVSKPWTFNGTAKLTNTNLLFGKTTLLIGGNLGDFISTPSNTDFGFSSGDFTLEAWIYPTTTDATDDPIFEFRTASGEVGLFYLMPTTRKLAYYKDTIVGDTGNAPTQNTWNHIAFVRDGSVLNAYLNGVREWNVSFTDTFGSTKPLRIGGNFNASSAFGGNIGPCRISKGAAIYNEDFIPPVFYPTK